MASGKEPKDPRYPALSLRPDWPPDGAAIGDMNAAERRDFARYWADYAEDHRNDELRPEEIIDRNARGVPDLDWKFYDRLARQGFSDREIQFDKQYGRDPNDPDNYDETGKPILGDPFPRLADRLQPAEGVSEHREGRDTGLRQLVDQFTGEQARARANTRRVAVAVEDQRQTQLEETYALRGWNRALIERERERAVSLGDGRVVGIENAQPQGNPPDPDHTGPSGQPNPKPGRTAADRRADAVARQPSMTTVMDETALSSKTAVDRRDGGRRRDRDEDIDWDR